MMQSLVLPVEWGVPEPEMRRAVNGIRSEGQSLVAIFGLGECQANGIQVEKRADNERLDSPDYGRDGKKTPAQRGLTNEVIPGGPTSYDSTLAFVMTDALARAGFASQEDDNAGGYLCEEAFYVSRHLAPSAGFAHLPHYPNSAGSKDDSQNTQHFNRMRDAVLKMLEEIARTLR